MNLPAIPFLISSIVTALYFPPPHTELNRFASPKPNPVKISIILKLPSALLFLAAPAVVVVFPVLVFLVVTDPSACVIVSVVPSVLALIPDVLSAAAAVSSSTKDVVLFSAARPLSTGIGSARLSALAAPFVRSIIRRYSSMLMSSVDRSLSIKYCLYSSSSCS